jgi:hypothetical protein
MSEKGNTPFILGMISIIAFCVALLLGATSCGNDERTEEQEILLSFPELSSMTVGQTHPFVVGLSIPAEGTEILTAKTDSGRVILYPNSQLLSKGETVKTFSITAKTSGNVVVRFSLGRLLSKDLPIRVFEQPLP